MKPKMKSNSDEFNPSAVQSVVCRTVTTHVKGAFHNLNGTVCSVRAQTTATQITDIVNTIRLLNKLIYEKPKYVTALPESPTSKELPSV